MQVILTLSRPEKWMLDFATYIMQKILNFFICVEVRILCIKLKYVWSSHFPEAITTKMQLGNDSFVFEYPVTHKQKLSFFAFWEAEKHVFHITPFRPTSYVLMRLKWLEVSKPERNWNKVKNFILVLSKLELCQLEMLIFIYKLMCQMSLIKLFISLLWI